MRRFLHNPLLVSAVCALLLIGAFPPFEWRLLAWVGLAPIFLMVERGRGGAGRYLVAGWLLGVLFYAAQYSWLPHTLVELGGQSVAVLLFFLLGVVCFPALFYGLALGAARWIWLRWGVSPYLSAPLFLCLQDALLGLFPFGGAPWGSLAATQTASLAARLLAPLAGGSALVLAMGAVNAGWAWAAGAFERGGLSGSWRGLLLLLLTAALASGWLPPGGEEERRDGFTALLVPGDRPVKPPEGETPRQGIRYYLSRTMAALEKRERAKVEEAAAPALHPPVILAVWPEAAVNGLVAGGNYLSELSGLASVIGADILLGSEARTASGRAGEGIGGRANGEAGGELNAAYLITGEGSGHQRYDKRELVPFGEYVPWGFRWAFGNKITAGEHDYQPGTGAAVLQWRGRGLGLAICFESILPAHMRLLARQGAEAVVVMANDQWLTPPARRHHLELTALRALEIGKEALFVANGGWAAHLREGRIVAAGDWRGGAIEVHPTVNSRITPWVRWGYGPLALLAALWLAGGLMLTRLTTPRRVRAVIHPGD